MHFQGFENPAEILALTRLNNEAVRRDKQILQLNKRLDREKQRTESIRETARKPAPLS